MILLQKERNLLFLAIILLALLLILPASCRPREAPAPPSAPGGEEGEKLPSEAQERFTATLYFADGQADRLVPEERLIVLAGKEPAVAVLEELIEGPEHPAHGRTVPPDVQVLGVEIRRGIAAANFSEELRSSHWGGSTGEILTVYAIVNTLAELPGIEQVQILIAGEKVETLVGHLELGEPLAPDMGLVSPP